MIGELLTAIPPETASVSVSPVIVIATGAANALIALLRSPLTYVIAIPLATRAIAKWKFDATSSRTMGLIAALLSALGAIAMSLASGDDLSSVGKQIEIIGTSAAMLISCFVDARPRAEPAKKI